MAKQNSITKFDTSLTEFLINALADKYGDAKMYAYRYNNLKVYMNPAKISEPHFFVSIGISEACFSIENGKKIEGALGNEDSYIKRWSDRANIHSELLAHWKILKDAVAAEQEEDAGRRAAAAMRVIRAETENKELEADMTGTGINKAKREELERRNKTGRLKRMKKDIK